MNLSDPSLWVMITRKSVEEEPTLYFLISGGTQEGVGLRSQGSKPIPILCTLPFSTEKQRQPPT